MLTAVEECSVWWGRRRPTRCGSQDAYNNPRTRGALPAAIPPPRHPLLDDSVTTGIMWMKSSSVVFHGKESERRPANL
jgi:hypothetical protein